MMIKSCRGGGNNKSFHNAVAAANNGSDHDDGGGGEVFHEATPVAMKAARCRRENDFNVNV